MWLSYRALMARSWAPTLALSCALGWLSFSAYGLALVLTVEAETGSFSTAGYAVAAFSAGAALLAPARGRLIDERGPRVILYLVPVHAIGIAVIVHGSLMPAAAPVLVAGSGLAGASAPPLIATARAVWPRVAGPELTRAAHGLNAALGDLTQMAGPALTGAVAALASPRIALVTLALGVVASAGLLSTVPAPGLTRTIPARGWGVLAESRGLRTLAIGELGLGLSFGALEVALPAAAADRGGAELAAVALTAFAATSLAASLGSGVAGEAHSSRTRYLGGMAVVGCSLLLCPLGGSIAALAAVLAAAGFGYGLLSVAAFELLDDVASENRGVEAFTWLTTSGGAGLAAGAVGAAGVVGTGGDALTAAALPAAGAAILTAWRRKTLRLVSCE